MRVGGFLAAGLVEETGIVARFFRLAPGNLFVAFVAAACIKGGLPSIAGCLAALSVMARTGKEWAALAAGFAVAALVASSNL
ncbi:AzlD domain-containing protein [Bradyrhizobium ganzhouense]|uniref:AzlD domain-containing protein n=1 Tax=Bradyrhizobium ganzhouense TaxID=1179767 RepID=UPI003CE681B4